MKKRLKLFFSIFTSCFAIFALCFGVYASIKVTYNVGGNIHYEIDNAYVDIETRVYSSNKLLDYADGAQIAINFQDVNLSDLSSMASSNGLTLKSTHKQTSLGEQFNSSLATSLNNISYSSTNGYAYFVVVNIKNKTPELVSAIISDNITLPQNSWVFHTGYLTGFDNSTTNNNMIIAFGLDDAGIEIASTSFNFQIDIDLGELKPTTTKYTIDETAKTLKINSDATGVVIIGKGLSTATNLQLSSQSKNISHVYCLEDCGDVSGTNHFITGLSNKGFIKINELQIIDLSNCIGITTINGGNFPGDGNCFANSTKLVKASCPNILASLSGYAFYGCTSLNYIKLPNSVTSIGSSAFSNTNLKTVIYTTSNTDYAYTNGKIEIINLKESTDINNYQWYKKCISQIILKIVFPSNIQRIGTNSFRYCSSLEHITIPSTVISIGTYAFESCKKLNYVTIENLSIANNITSSTSQGYLVNYIQSGGTVTVKCSNLSDITSTYLKGSDFIQPSSVVDGYATFIKI